jgi:hypothetical protein
MALRQESQPRRRRALVAGTISAVGALALSVPALAGGLNPNPANNRHLLNKPIDGERYDPATHCDHGQVPPGMKALENWLEHNVRGDSWGIYRCERLKSGASTAAHLGYASRDGNYSLHSEGRAIDWHLDSTVHKDDKAAHRLIDTLLATDRDGNVRALARRMGIQGLIYDCHAWWAGMEEMGEYNYCFKSNGDRRHHLDPTQAHENHVHIEINKAAAHKKTSFWRSPLA